MDGGGQSPVRGSRSPPTADGRPLAADPPFALYSHNSRIPLRSTPSAICTLYPFFPSGSAS